MKRLAILGASGHGKVVADCAEQCGWDSIKFFDEAWPQKQSNGIWRVIGDTNSLIERCNEFDGILVAIGDNYVRQLRLRELILRGLRVAVLVHPAASVSQYAALGVGSVVLAGAVVNADASIGMGTIINTAATVDHDCILGDAVHISPGANLAGGVRVGDRSWLGVGSAVIQLTKIGSDVVVGAGAAVVSDVADGSVVVGVPARVRE